MHALTLAGSSSLVLAALIALAWPASPAGATREYARSEDKDCSFCHVNESGGGPRTEQGRVFEANGHRFGVASWTNDENRRTYLRARSALLATWYAECDRLLDEVALVEDKPGGKTLIESTRKRYSMFPRAWLRSADKLLQKGARGRPNALRFLTKLESQFPESAQGKDATQRLDRMAADEELAGEIEKARAAEQARMLLLRGRTAYELGELTEARGLFQQVLAHPEGAALREDVTDRLTELTETEAALDPGSGAKDRAEDDAVNKSGDDPGGAGEAPAPDSD